MMWNKHFKSMYTGSMVGSGALVFAVMGYAVANMVADTVTGAQVELNPRLLSAILGESEEDVKEAIEKLCAEDGESRTKLEGGRRLVRLGQFDYRVVNGPKYMAIRNEEDRRAQNREAQRRHRDKRRAGGGKGSHGNVLAGEQDRQDEVMRQAPADPAVRRSIREGLRSAAGENGAGTASGSGTD